MMKARAFLLLCAILLIVQMDGAAAGSCGSPKSSLDFQGSTIKKYSWASSSGARITWQSCRAKCNSNSSCYNWSWTVSMYGGGCSLYNGYDRKITNFSCDRCEHWGGTCT
jgi:hypothetical protein